VRYLGGGGLMRGLLALDRNGKHSVNGLLSGATI
jgi:hypothetical protein